MKIYLTIIFLFLIGQTNSQTFGIGLRLNHHKSNIEREGTNEYNNNLENGQVEMINTELFGRVEFKEIFGQIGLNNRVINISISDHVSDGQAGSGPSGSYSGHSSSDFVRMNGSIRYVGLSVFTGLRINKPERKSKLYLTLGANINKSISQNMKKDVFGDCFRSWYYNGQFDQYNSFMEKNEFVASKELGLYSKKLNYDFGMGMQWALFIIDKLYLELFVSARRFQFEELKGYDYFDSFRNSFRKGVGLVFLIK